MISWDFKTQSIGPIGLDIDYNSIRMIQLQIRGDQLSVYAVNKERIEPCTNEDELTRNNFIISAVKTMYTNGNFYGKNVVSCLPSNELKIASLRLTEAESEKVEHILKYEVVQRFGLDPEKDAMDYIVAGNVRQGDEIKKELILFATDNEIIKNHIEMLESAGLKPMSIDIIPCALFRSFERSFRRQEDRENAIIFVDVGSSYTTVIFGRGGEISFVKQIKIGAGDFDSEVASKLGITNREAEVLREELQAENYTATHEKQQRIDASTRQIMVNAISKIAEKLASEISRCLRYYTVTFRGQHIERAVFTGVGSHENILLDIMRRQLTVEIEIAEPFRGFDLSNERINMMCYRDFLCEWAIAVGLSLKGWNGIKNQRYVAKYSM